MKLGFKLFGLAALACATSSFAIAGIGFQYAPNIGATVDGASGNVYANGPVSASYTRNAVNNLSGFGTKIWIDAIPFIDIEATGNLQFSSYSSSLSLSYPTSSSTNATISAPIKYSMGFPGLPDAKLGIGAGVFDLTVQYPFLKLPPVVNILKLFVGAGITYTFQTPVLDSAVVRNATQSVLDSLATQAQKGTYQAPNATTLAQSVGKALAAEGYQSGFGGHVEFGARAKLPVIPIAIFADTKYYIGGLKTPIHTNKGFVVEAGGGFAF